MRYLQIPVKCADVGADQDIDDGAVAGLSYNPAKEHVICLKLLHFYQIAKKKNTHIGAKQVHLNNFCDLFVLSSMSFYQILDSP